MGVPGGPGGSQSFPPPFLSHIPNLTLLRRNENLSLEFPMFPIPSPPLLLTCCSHPSGPPWSVWERRPEQEELWVTPG